MTTDIAPFSTHPPRTNQPTGSHLDWKSASTRAESLVFITTRRNPKPTQPGHIRINPIEDALAGDEFHKSKMSYQHLKTVTPVFNLKLKAQIETAILEYERENGIIPSAWQKPHPANFLGLKRHSNKQGRLQAALWVFQQLPAAETAQEAMNMLGCSLDRVETVAFVPGRKLPPGSMKDEKPLRLTESVLESVAGKSVQASYGIQHITLFNANGGVQVQCLPEHLRGVNYKKRAEIQGVVLLTKPGASLQDFW